jgi:hypothetical protein
MPVPVNMPDNWGILDYVGSFACVVLTFGVLIRRRILRLNTDQS